MKKSDRIRRNADIAMRKIREIAKHMRNVEDNCLILGEKLIERGEVALGKHLIANGRTHDVSKFYGIEFEFMAPGQKYDEENAQKGLRLAVQHHRETNYHHPEAWAGGIVDMPDVYLAELCCDLKSRSEEFGTALMDYIEKAREERWKIPSNHPVYIKILDFVDLLCSKPFENIPKG